MKIKIPKGDFCNRHPTILCERLDRSSQSCSLWYEMLESIYYNYCNIFKKCAQCKNQELIEIEHEKDDKCIK